MVKDTVNKIATRKCRDALEGRALAIDVVRGLDFLSADLGAALQVMRKAIIDLAEKIDKQH